MTDSAIGVRAGLTRFTFLALAAMVAAALALALAAPATAKLGGKTVLAPEAATFETLAAAGVAVAPVGSANAGSKGIAFPVTGGRVNLDNLSGKVLHSGGLRFSGHGTSLTLERFAIKLGGKNVIRAKVAGGGSVRLADLDLDRAKVKQRGGKVVISRVDVLLARKAAKALSATFGLPVLTGADLGEAKVRVRP